jgi:PPOX class probable F420-dependent enzyme
MLDPSIRALAGTGKNFGTVSVHMPNGDIATNVMWVDADDDHIMFNTEVHRHKYKALQDNPQVTVLVWPAGNPYGFGEVRGTVVETITGPDARAHIDHLSRRYTGGDYANPIQSERVIVKVRPDRQFARGIE